MSAEKKDVTTSADVVSAKTLEKLKNMVIPDDWTPPPLEPKVDRIKPWSGPSTNAMLEVAKRNATISKEKK